MDKRALIRGIGSVLVALAAAGCGGDGGDDDQGGGACSTPKLTGSPGVFFPGTASLMGSGMLLPGPTDGLELELLIGDGNLDEGVYPEGLFRIPTVCGSSFTYEITDLAAGTYVLTYEVYDPNSEDLTPSFTATSTNSVTVTDGAMVTFDPMF
jgi:hypothetical protein